MTPAEARLPLGLKFVHGFGSVAYGIKDNGFSTFLLLFYNQVVGLDARLVSVALMLALVIDAFADPIIGHLSDRTYTRWGRRLPWLYLAPIPLAFAWVLLWAPPTGSDMLLFWYLVATAVVVRALLSCCEVPSVALLPELTRDYDERTSLMRYRYLFGWIGGLVIAVLAYTVFLVPDADHAVGQLNANGYWLYGLTGAVVMTVSVLVSAAGQHRRVAHWPAVRPEKSTIREAVSEIFESFSNKAFRAFVVAAACAFVSQGVTFSISNYLYLYVWEFPEYAFKLYPFILFLSVVACFFLVGPFNRRYGKKETAMYGSIIGVMFWTTPFWLRLAGLWPEPGSDLSTYLICAFAFAATLFSVMVMISGASMIADIVEASEVDTGRRTEGLFFAGNFFMQKCATGLGIAISGQIIALAGLPDKAVPGAVDAAVINRMMLIYGVLVVILAVAAALLFKRFPITRAEHEARLELLGDAARANPDATGAHP